MQLSWHWSGLIQTKLGVVEAEARSAVSCVSGTMRFIRDVLLRMSEKYMNGLCFWT